MKIAVQLLFLLFAPLCIAADHPDAASWQELFAPDLSNAVAPHPWKFDDGILVATSHDTLWTKASYGDFILDLEFKVELDSNSGVFLRSGNIRDDLAAIEIQVHGSGDGSKYGMVGAIYDALPPSVSAARPVGEWNRFTITCKGPHIAVLLNGVQIIDADLDRWSQARQNPDGTENKFALALKDFARRGPIGLQGLHGAMQAPVWYRNMKIKVLD